MNATPRDLLVDRPAEAVLRVTLNRPEVRNALRTQTLAEGLLFERREFHSTFALDDQKEGMRAFVEKRKPSFRNR